MQISELSPKKIRNSGDGAKLISSNDDKGFTFRGRFDLPSEAACVGRVTTEKAHNAPVSYTHLVPKTSKWYFF